MLKIIHSINLGVHPEEVAWPGAGKAASASVDSVPVRPPSPARIKE